MPRFKNTGPVAQHTATGAPVEPGGFVVIDEPTDHDTAQFVEVPDAPASLDDLQVAELEAQATTRGVTVEGTGKGGRVLKSDLISALEADPNDAEEAKP